MTKSGHLGAAHYEVKNKPNGMTSVRVSRDYRAGVPPTTAQRVWQIIADFGAAKTLFPLMLSVYLTYPDASSTTLNMVRSMTFAPPDLKSPLSAQNSLAFAVEKLVELDERARRLAYISPMGMPVQNYRSVMKVTGDDACRLTWTSTFTVDPGQEGFASILAGILAGGANQIATTLGLE